MLEEEVLGYPWDPWSLWPKTNLKKKRGKPEGAKDYREIKRKIRTEMKVAKDTWIQGQSRKWKHTSERTHQLVKDLTTEKLRVNLQPYKTSWGNVSQRRMKFLTGDRVLLRHLQLRDWWGPSPQIPDEEHHPILQEKVEAAVKESQPVWITYQQKKKKISIPTNPYIFFRKLDKQLNDA